MRSCAWVGQSQGIFVLGIWVLPFSVIICYETWNKSVFALLLTISLFDEQQTLRTPDQIHPSRKKYAIPEIPMRSSTWVGSPWDPEVPTVRWVLFGCEGESRQTGSWAPVDPKQAWEGSIFDEQRDPDKKWPNKKELQQKILVSHLSYQEQTIHEGSYINTSWVIRKIQQWQERSV